MIWLIKKKSISADMMGSSHNRTLPNNSYSYTYASCSMAKLHHTITIFLKIIYRMLTVGGMMLKLSVRLGWTTMKYEVMSSL